MADGASLLLVDNFLAASFNGSAFTSFGPVYVQLHTGAPGPAGTNSIATNNTRLSAGSNPAFTAPAAGACTNLNALTWTNVPAAEQYSHVSIWDSVSGGNFIGSGTLTANPVNIGDTFAIPVSILSISMAVAA